MRDIYTRGLLTVITEALQPPPYLTPMQLAEWYSHTLRGRLSMIREALRIAQEEADAELATLMIDEAIAHHPNPPSHTVRALGGGEARIPLPPQANPPSYEGELPIPEHVLCSLLYRHWCMTIEGKPPHETFVAFRPIGWTGVGDPHERLTAPTRNELLHLLLRRHLVIEGPDATQTPAT